MATAKKTENTQSVAPVKDEAAAQVAAENKNGEGATGEVDERLVTVSVTLGNGADLDLKMFRDPMDAGDEVMEYAEQEKFVSYIRGLITPQSKMTMKAKQSTSRDLLEIILPAYQEATQQGEG